VPGTPWEQRAFGHLCHFENYVSTALVEIYEIEKKWFQMA